MSGISEKYNNIIKDIENHISNEKEREYVSQKMSDISIMFLDIIDRMTQLDTNRLDRIEEVQDKISKEVEDIGETVNLIKSDIYEEEGYDFEIVCPYCNNEFVADIESELKEEIECPECHNIIELDWDEKDECFSCSGGCCSSCSAEEQDDESEETDTDLEEINDDTELNDDDM